MTTIAALSGIGSTGPGVHQETLVAGDSGNPSGRDSTRKMSLNFVNGDGDPVMVTFEVTSQDEVNTDFIWPFDSNASLTITVEAEEV